MYNSDKAVFHYGRFILIFCLVVLSLFYATTSYARQADQLDKVKAAYIYNFTKYIEFPEGRFDGTSNDFNLCIKNAPEFVELFESIEGVKIKDRNFRVRLVSDDNELDQCHFLYVQPGVNMGMGNVLDESLTGKFVTISSGPGFVNNGGMIGFVLIDNKVKVEINLASTRQAGFAISARLLEVSRVVDKELE